MSDITLTLPGYDQITLNQVTTKTSLSSSYPRSLTDDIEITLDMSMLPPNPISTRTFPVILDTVRVENEGDTLSLSVLPGIQNQVEI